MKKYYFIAIALVTIVSVTLWYTTEKKWIIWVHFLITIIWYMTYKHNLGEKTKSK